MIAYEESERDYESLVGDVVELRHCAVAEGDDVDGLSLLSVGAKTSREDLYRCFEDKNIRPYIAIV